MTDEGSPDRSLVPSVRSLPEKAALVTRGLALSELILAKAEEDAAESRVKSQGKVKVDKANLAAETLYQRLRAALVKERIANERKARNVWGKLFDDYQDEILKVWQDSPNLSFDAAVAQVLGPKAHRKED